MSQKIVISETVVHSYHPAVASEVGINAAVLFYNICYWVAENTANERNFVNGKYWTYNSVSAYAKMFPEFSDKQIRTALEKLEDNGYIQSGSFNEDPYDRTKWYTVASKAIRFVPIGQMEDTNRANDNINNNISDNTNNKQADNNITDNSHKEHTVSKDTVKVHTVFSGRKNMLREKPIEKYFSLKDKEEDMLHRVSMICRRYYDDETAKEIYSTIEYFFECYTERTGKIHPILTDDTLERIIDTIADFSDDEYCHYSGKLIEEPGVFRDMVDEYFKTDFGKINGGETNYRLPHFVSYEILSRLAQRLI